MERAVFRAKISNKAMLDYSSEVLRFRDNLDIPMLTPKVWTPSNPELKFFLRKEVCLSDDEWETSAFPFNNLPHDIKNHVNTIKWKTQIQELPRLGMNQYVPLMEKVLENLTKGCDAEVRLPGSSASYSRNHFEDPQLDVPRIADALCSEIKAGHMAGPFQIGFVKNAKVNGFISVVKPDNSRRQVGNLSAPAGMSFNDGISSQVLEQWTVGQTTSRQFADMIARAGKNAILTCSDMKSAYKNLPVSLDQRRLQVFRFCGKEFVDLKLIFGDKSACMFYDRFHSCILSCFVLPELRIPRTWIGRTIDDLTSVMPARCAGASKEFVKTYRRLLMDLNIGAAPEDPLRKKAFDGHTSGEVLGIWFDTTLGTWCLPKEKSICLLNLLEESIRSESLSLHKLEVLHGKLAHFGQHAPPISLLTSEVLIFLKSLLEDSSVNSKRDMVTKPVPPSLHRDLRTIAAIIRYTMEVPLPIVQVPSIPAADALKIWTDASGHIIASPSLGIYIPSRFGERPFVASLAFPRYFLLSMDTFGHKAYCKTTTLECLGLLGALCSDPLRFAEKEALFHIDNVASVFALRKGHSRDEWATTVVRAARVVSAGIGCSLFMKWERRRSSRESEIADDLTHNLVGQLNDKELEAYLLSGQVSFPEPVLQWMANPRRDLDLGGRILMWLRKQYVGLQILRERINKD